MNYPICIQLYDYNNVCCNYIYVGNESHRTDKNIFDGRKNPVNPLEQDLNICKYVLMRTVFLNLNLN